MSQQLGEAATAIEAGDLDALARALSILPISQLSVSKSDEILVHFLTLAAKNNRTNIAREIILFFDQISSDDRKLSTFNYLFLLSNVTDETLKFLAVNLTENTFVETIIEFIEHDGGDTTKMACQRAVEAFGIGINHPNTLKQLYDMAWEEGNDDVAEVMEVNYVQSSPIKPKPSWMGNFTDLDTLPREDQIILPEVVSPGIQIPTDIEDQVDLLLGGMRDAGIGIDDIEKARSDLTEQLAQVTPDLRLQLMKPILIGNTNRYLSDDVELFRILGPCNAVYGADLTTDHICSRYGGCRQFFCLCVETIDPEDDVIYEDIDWFTGHCQVCLNRIRNRYFAIRKPLVHGSWKGCYCSFECLREDYDQPEIGAMAIIEAVEKQMNEIGIQDRITQKDLNEEEREEQRNITDTEVADLSLLMGETDLN